MLFRAFAVFVLALAVSGCASHAGPYVTNISSDGRGGLTVEKCMTRFDPWMYTVANEQCTSTNLRMGQEPQATAKKE